MLPRPYCRREERLVLQTPEVPDCRSPRTCSTWVSVTNPRPPTRFPPVERTVVQIRLPTPTSPLICQATRALRRHGRYRPLHGGPLALTHQ